MKFLFFFCIWFPTLLWATEPLRVVYYDRYYPRSWMENGKMRGILIDIIDEAAVRRLGIPVIHSGYPWKRAQIMVEQQKADAFVTLPTKERLAYTLASKVPVIEFSLRIITRNNHPRLEAMKPITRLEELKGYKIVDYMGDGWAEKHLKEMDVEWLPKIDSIFPFLVVGRADLAVASQRTLHVMQKMGYDSRLIVLPNKLSSVSFHLCIGTHSPYQKRLPDFDRVFKEMLRQGIIQQIENAYY